MSTLINVIQSSHNHTVHRDLEEGRAIEAIDAIDAIEATEATRMYHTENKEDYSRNASRSLQDIRVIRRHKKAEETCMTECKACICLSVVTLGLLYALAVVIILIVEDQRGPEGSYGSVGPYVQPEDGSLS